MVLKPIRGSALPIDEALPELCAVLERSASAVLRAPPGAGKTTKVPFALLDAPWMVGRRILLLEPRRVAARAAARRMATMIGESVGNAVGFRVRGESRVSTTTRIEVVTEGVLTQMILDDASLEKYGAVLFDEFHERSIHADLGLALTLQSQELLRPELRVLVMSATIDATSVASLLHDAPIVVCEGFQYAVEVRHRVSRPDVRIEHAVAAAVRYALENETGSVLAFLPGMGEIKRCHDALRLMTLPRDVRILSLHGDLSSAAQDAAILPAGAGCRKVVLATAIAESSLTIDGVRVVIDAGLSRIPRFSPRSGMTRLHTVRVSRSSADQRAGRAGRTSPGVCYRLWSVEEDAQLLDRAAPEILEADLASLALDLSRAGVASPGSLRWMDEPPAAALSQARDLLIQLGALDTNFRIVPHGQEMAALGVHPRLSHMLLAARERQLGATACLIAGLLDERDLFRRDGVAHDVDLRSRVAFLMDDKRDFHSNVDQDAAHRIRDRSRGLRSQLGVHADEIAIESATGVLIALAYPDRVGRVRPGQGNRYLLRNGIGALLHEPGSLVTSEFLAIADLDGRSPDARIRLAAPIERSDVESVFAANIVSEDAVRWEAVAGAVSGVHRERLGAIVLKESYRRNPPWEQVVPELLCALSRQDGLALSWGEEADRLRQRVAFLRSYDASWPDFSDATLLATLDDWLEPHLRGVRSRADIARLPLQLILGECLPWQRRRDLDVLAPSHIVVPSGSRLPIDYSDPHAPMLAVRLQEMFGLMTTPMILGGNVPLSLCLLSPARRPVQVTRDLAGFWRSSYFLVRKELRGRYPKHPWPLNPTGALPTDRRKPR